MKFFFYLPVLVVAVTYLYNAIKGNKAIRQLRKDQKYFKMQKKNGIPLARTPGRLAWDNMSDTQAGSVGWFIASVVFGLIFSFIGLLSYNWIVFGFLILYLPIMGFLVKIGIPRFAWFINGVAFLFTVLNSYHLHIDLLQVIKNLF